LRENLALGREKIPGLLLMTCSRDFFSGEELNADVVIDSPGEPTVQAQVIAAGALVNGSGRVGISGGLFASDIRNQGQLRVDAVAAGFEFGNYRTLVDFKFLKNFLVHYIQEGGDE